MEGQAVGETGNREGHQVRLTWEASGLVCSMAGSSLLRPLGSEPPTCVGPQGPWACCAVWLWAGAYSLLVPLLNKDTHSPVVLGYCGLITK